MKYFTLLTCFLLVGILAGCTPQEPLTSTTTGPEDSASEEKQSDEGGNVTGDDVRRKVGEATEAVEEFSRQQMQEAFQNSQRSLEQINEKIALLKKDMGQLEEAAQVQFQESINKLDSTFENAQQRLSQLRDTGTEAWTRAQDDLQQAMDDLEEAYRQVAETFEKAKSSESEGESTDGS